MNLIKNLILTILNVGALMVALVVVEYDTSKLQHPLADWLPTRPVPDLILSWSIIVLAIIDVSVLFFVAWRQLDFHRRWIWVTTLLTLILVAVMALVLGENFLPVVWP